MENPKFLLLVTVFLIIHHHVAFGDDSDGEAQAESREKAAFRACVQELSLTVGTCVARIFSSNLENADH